MQCATTRYSLKYNVTVYSYNQNRGSQPLDDCGLVHIVLESDGGQTDGQFHKIIPFHFCRCKKQKKKKYSLFFWGINQLLQKTLRVPQPGGILVLGDWEPLNWTSK